MHVLRVARVDVSSGQYFYVSEAPKHFEKTICVANRDELLRV